MRSGKVSKAALGALIGGLLSIGTTYINNVTMFDKVSSHELVFRLLETGAIEFDAKSETFVLRKSLMSILIDLELVQHSKFPQGELASGSSSFGNGCT